MANLKFNANQYEPHAGTDPVPPGDYLLQVSDSGIEPTKDGKGKILKCTFTVVEGKYKNRRIFERFNIMNASKEAEEIAFAKLSSLCRACGKMEISDSGQLHGIPFKAKVGVRAGTNGFEPSNVIKTYYPKIGENESVNVESSGSESTEEDAGWNS